ncbi:hypothetical protein R3P38DRAFT_2790136 [Favolaschia claudopus]|uniref:Uncharacterized protein n=1 Tax=Favolaschia claudopus TaxID=2862362 RepID=A0AAW0AID2_9AGAR
MWATIWQGCALVLSPSAACTISFVTWGVFSLALHDLKLRLVELLRLPQPATAIPSFYGIIETTLDAMRLIYAAQRGAVPSVNRCLNDVERRTMIKSGAIFVYRAEEATASSWTGSVDDMQMVYCGPVLKERTTFCCNLYESLAPTIHGLTKKTITILIEGTTFEVISYYSSLNLPGTLQRPSAHHDIAASRPFQSIPGLCAFPIFVLLSRLSKQMTVLSG